MTLKPYWTPETVARLLVDIIVAEVARTRPGLLGVRQLLAPLTDAPLHITNPLFNQEFSVFNLDSLEFLNVVTAVAVLFHLHETEVEPQLLERRYLRGWVDAVLASRTQWDEAISFLTSGSTGQPKLCTHPMAWLEEEIAFFAAQFHDRRRILSAVPNQHIYGFLFATMLPATLGIPVRDVRDSLPASVLRRAQAGDLIVAHPAFFDLALRSPFTLAPNVSAVSSTGRCPTTLWHQLHAAGLAQLTEVYGSSETAGIGIRQVVDAPLRLLPHWSRQAGRADAISRVDANGAAVTVALPDQVDWLDATQFQVIKRHDGAVQVGGINVFPARVQELLCRHPDVAAAQVRQASAAADGRLKAFVVPSADCVDSAQLPERLHAWLATRLTPPEMPRAITIGTELPRSSLGKLADWE
jgi:4-coumarate--CoA ligase (photoactive yellow protein activation family)